LSEQVEDPKLAGHPRILELEIRLEIDDAVIPAELATIDHDGQGRGEKGLGGRADLEHRACTDRRATGLAAHAETPAVNEAIVGDDPKGEAGRVGRFHAARNIALDLGDQGLDAHLQGRSGRFRGPRRTRQIHAEEHGERQKRDPDAAAIAKGCWFSARSDRHGLMDPAWSKHHGNALHRQERGRS
jgi:hypothetical protein